MYILGINHDDPTEYKAAGIYLNGALLLGYGMVVLFALPVWYALKMFRAVKWWAFSLVGLFISCFLFFSLGVVGENQISLLLIYLISGGLVGSAYGGILVYGSERDGIKNF